jgi:hypothetical protein
MRRSQAAVPAAAGPRFHSSSRRSRNQILAMTTGLRRIVVEPGH